jgi:hypothetical protein
MGSFKFGGGKFGNILGGAPAVKAGMGLANKFGKKPMKNTGIKAPVAKAAKPAAMPVKKASPVAKPFGRGPSRGFK